MPVPSAFEAIKNDLFKRYDAHLSGNENGLFVTVASGAANEEVQTALESSALQLGFPKGAGGQAVTAINNVEQLEPKELIFIIETLDPLAVVASDVTATKSLADAYHMQIALEVEQRLLGRPLLCFENFESKISSPEGKKLTWKLLKQLRDHV